MKGLLYDFMLISNGNNCQFGILEDAKKRKMTEILFYFQRGKKGEKDEKRRKEERERKEKIEREKRKDREK